uniref:Uncharacterized protein n=1 Tax=Rhizophora mucronata TaxID=61149 RepID=A0A2P2PFZ9_RHIMU
MFITNIKHNINVLSRGTQLHSNINLQQTLQFFLESLTSKGSNLFTF